MRPPRAIPSKNRSVSRRAVLSAVSTLTVALAFGWPGVASADHDPYSPDDNDLNTSSRRVALNDSLENQNNFGATVLQPDEDDEDLDCEGREYRHTVWYIFTVPALMCCTVCVVWSHSTSTWPPSSAVIAGAVPW